jgi:hypothetical protein
MRTDTPEAAEKLEEQMTALKTVSTIDFQIV